MWIITNLNTGQFYHLIPEKRKYVVGRTGADIILKDDTSISRSHAILEFQDSCHDSLILTDSGSKYGTFYNSGISNNKKIVTNEKVELHDEDKIRFGLLKNEWKISHVPLKSMSSALPANKTKDFEQHLAKLGGVSTNNWETDCTHLTMSEIGLTIKVLYALLGNVPIVSCEYWKDLLTAARSGQTALPRPELYLPKKSGLFMNKSDLDFGFLPNRKSLFSGKTFVFMNKKHFDTYGTIVQMAGGACRNLNCGVQKAVLTMPNVVIIQYVPPTQSQSTQTINSISDYLESNSRRIIPEHEIGFAIVHCSIEKYCNPAYKITSDLLPSTSSMAYEEIEADSTENTRAQHAPSISESDLEVPETDSTTLSFPTVDIEKRVNDVNSKLTEQEGYQLQTDKQDEEDRKKRKRSSNNNVNVLDVDDNDDDFLPVVKRPNFSRLSAATLEGDQLKEKESPHVYKDNGKQKVHATTKQNPLPIVINCDKQKARVSTAGFLNKTQPHATQKECESSNAGKQSKEAPKRGRIALITDDDSGDENDLFNFGTSTKTNATAKKRRIAENNIPTFEDSEDEIFAFSKPPDCSENIESEDLEPTQEFVEKPKKTAYTPIKQPKLIPEKVSTAGWLTSSLSKFNIKQLKEGDTGLAEVSKNDETKNLLSEKEKILDDDSLEEKKCPIIMSGFDVRFSVIPKRYKEKLQNTSLNNSSRTNHSNSAVNFKVFVKKCNYKPQNQVIKCSRSVC